MARGYNSADDSDESALDRESRKDEQIFELRQENARLRNQITYLQEQLALAEDEVMNLSTRSKMRIEELERQLGDALFGK